MKLKEYLKLSVSAYGSIQFSGIIIGTITLWPFFGRQLFSMLYPDTNDQIFIDFIAWVFVAPICGLFFTIIPTILYSLSLPFLVLTSIKRFNSKKWSYFISAIATLAFFSLQRSVGIGDHEAYWPMLVSSFVAGSIGTFVTLKIVHNQWGDHTR